MNYDPLSRDYGPRDPFQQYHGQPEAEQQRMEHMIEEKKRAYMREMQANQIHGAGRVIGPEVMKEPNISVNIERMDKILAHQEELLTMLEQRMSPFVRAYPKQSREEGARTASCQSALSERLYIQTQRADFICTRINALIESIDL
jgi:hypothetical protein